IENIKKACFLTDRTFKYILEQIKPGITEKKLVLLIELFIRENNADIAFPPICAFGNNSSIPHHQPNDQRLKSNDQILLDFGAKINNYCSDMTRTVFLGKAKGEQKRIYRTVLKAQKKAIEFLASNLRLLSSDTKPLKTSSLDQVARSYIISEGFPAIPHSLGHGIGIEVHEGLKISPKSKDVIKPGMVFSIEPGIYLPNIGGVRIEDLVLVNGKGIQILTSSPRHLIEL
ncbi:MAG: M24 family metallopeptidase, partial [bacterium]|nr:M24 family metallopeptidase [bacterium]